MMHYGWIPWHGDADIERVVKRVLWRLNVEHNGQTFEPDAVSRRWRKAN